MNPSQPSIRAVSQLRTEVVAGIRDYYLEHGIVEVRPPLVVDVTGACEDVDTLLAVWGSDRSFPASNRQVQRGYLSQTGQLALETVVAECGACWCHTNSFRDDEPSSRHLRDFELIEEEFTGNGAPSNDVANAIALFEQLLCRIQAVLRAGIARAIDAEVAAEVGADMEGLRAALNSDFPRVSYDAAIEMANAVRRSRQQALLRWGQDLTPGDEMAVIQHASQGHDQLLPTFVTAFPAELKFFNMKLDPRDPRKVLSADVLVPFAGETVGAAVREDDYESLLNRLLSSPMFKTLQARNLATLEPFKPYLNLIRTKASPLHAGYGIGLDRLLQFIAGVSDIRDTSVAYRLTTGEING